jgi:beta-phosphoglucomutase
LNKFKAILFDMDGVIADSMRHHADAWRTVFRERCNIDLTPEDIFLREGMSGISSIIDILKDKGVQIPSREELLSLREQKLRLFERHKIEVFPSVYEILNYLTSKNIKIGLVTGSLRRSVDYILTDDIKNFFNVIISVDDISNGKPHPEPFLKGVELIGLNGVDVLAVENAPMGIRSAKRAGLICWAIETTLKKEFLAEADIIFSDHKELFECLKKVYSS